MIDEERQRQRRDAVTSRVRLRGHDYSSRGAYFVTVCTEERRCLLGDVLDHEFVPVPAARMIEACWLETREHFPSITLDAMVVMPNHVHGLIMLPSGTDVTDDPGHPSLSKILQWFKSKTIHEYIAGVQEQGWPRFRRRLWQSGFFDHIVRDDASLERIRVYIEANPSRWPWDDLHPNPR